MQIRQLATGDELRLEAFLASHRDSSMFLRSNARRAGLGYAGERFQAIYAGAFRDGVMVGVVAHGWNGMLLIQAPELGDELARACLGWSQRPVSGLTGPLEQVRQVTAALRLDTTNAKFRSDDWLYALDLVELVVPPELATGATLSRPPLEAERERLHAWRLAYDIELLGSTDSVETRARTAAALDRQVTDGAVWVAVDRGLPVSIAAFTAVLPDIVQLGGIYTPPELRGWGFARVAIAGSLLAARERGVTRAVLFTANPNAVRTYEALGFRRIGDYALILLH